jgi:hypothetical protein
VTNNALPAVVPPPEPTLDDLAASFRAVHAGIAYGVRQTVASQIECGRLLEQMQARVRATVGGGYWGVWIKTNCGVEIRQVQRYIKHWREYRKLSQSLGSDATAKTLLVQRDLEKLNSKS